MEFPELGQHCSERTCNQLDFLPIQCDACEKVFCKDHIRFDDHHCPSAYKIDKHVPQCPLCGQPVPVHRGERPDVIVGEHINRDCQSDPAKKKRKAFSNRCSASHCKRKELVPVVCASCRLNFCIRHRHQQDHECKGFQGSGRTISNSGAAAIQRYEASVSQRKSACSKISNSLQSSPFMPVVKNVDLHGRQQNGSALQNNMSEDEALARALHASLLDAYNLPEDYEDTNLAFARQLQNEESRFANIQGLPPKTNTSQEVPCKTS